jgi:hypothetical protein
MRLHSMQQALKLQAHIKPARAAQSANPAGRGHPLCVVLQRSTRGKPSRRGAAAATIYIHVATPFECGQKMDGRVIFYSNLASHPSRLTLKGLQYRGFL